MTIAIGRRQPAVEKRARELGGQRRESVEGMDRVVDTRFGL